MEGKGREGGERGRGGGTLLQGVRGINAPAHLTAFLADLHSNDVSKPDKL